MAFYDYKTVSYARPQAAVPTNNPMVSDTAQAALNPVGTTTDIVDKLFSRGIFSSTSNSIWGDLGNIAGKMFGGGTINSISGDLGNRVGKMPESLSNNPESNNPERRKYESALMEAEAILGPQYQRAREQTMSEVDRNMVSRGFYGQAPGDAIRASTLTDLDTAYQSALGNYATNIMDRRTQMDLQKEQMDLQKYMFDKKMEEQRQMFDKEMEEQRQQSKDRKKSGLLSGIGMALGGFLGGPAGAAIGTGIGNILNNIFS